MNRYLVYRFDNFEVDPEAWRLTRGGKEIRLDPVVLKLLIHLIANHGRLVTRQELMDTVWGDTVISEAALTKAVARLRKALGDDSATHRYLETVRSQGYRFVAPLETRERADSPAAPVRRTPARTVRRRALVAALSLFSLIVLTAYWFLAAVPGSRQDDTVRSLAVLPLRNLTGDPEKAYYVDGLQDLLITELAQIPGLRVISRQSTMRYRDSPMSTAEIAGELGVDALVEGSLMREGSEIELTVQLIHSRNDEHLWAERYRRDISLVFDLISEAANAIGVEIGTTSASTEVTGPAHTLMGQVDPRAIDLYARGIMHLNSFTRDGIRSAIEELEAAVAIEPEFALAWGELGATHAMQGMFGFAPPRESKEKFRAASLRAIEANPRVSIGHAGFGHARLYTGDFDGACESFAEALRLNPSAPYAIHGLADCQLLDGRMDESVATCRELLTISPFSAMHSLPLVTHLYMARQFDESVNAARALQARVPQYSIHWFFAWVYWEQGRFDEALEEERLELERHGDAELLAALERGLEAAGPAGALRSMAEALVARSNDIFVDPFDIASIFARAGNIEEALHWLGKAVDVDSYKVTYLAFWPHFDGLRNDARFRVLLERVYGEKLEDIPQT
jgi:TolB-like protein/DNA-binding winged helix-turn-helix (wHTH) protein